MGNGARAARGVHQVRAVGPQVEQPPSFTREDLLTANDVAEILQVKRSTALDYMRRGVIPARKIGRRWYALRPRLDAHIGDLFETDPYRR
ncbi:MAG: helix-turn-helix domain-containing protein [Solirubrobacterales bacterium]